MAVCDAHGAVWESRKQMSSDEGYLLETRFMQRSLIQEKLLDRDMPTVQAMGFTREQYRLQVESTQGASPWLICEDCIVLLELGPFDLDAAREAAKRYWMHESTAGHIPGSRRKTRDRREGNTIDMAQTQAKKRWWAFWNRPRSAILPSAANSTPAPAASPKPATADDPGEDLKRREPSRRRSGGTSKSDRSHSEGDFILQEGEAYVQQCLQGRYQEVNEPRTWQTYPGYRRVIELLNSQDNEAASKEAQKLAGKGSDYDAIYASWGTALLGMRKLDHARSVLQEGLARCRRKYVLCTTLGEVELESENIRSALYWWAQAMHCQESLQGNLEVPTAYLYLHDIAEGIGLPEVALALDRRRRSREFVPEVADRLRRLARTNNELDIAAVLRGLKERYLRE